MLQSTQLEQIDSEMIAQIDLINQSAWEIRENETTKALQLATEILDVSREASYKKGAAESLQTIGICNYFLANYQVALLHSLEALELFKELDNKHGISSALNSIGNVYQNIGDYAFALDYHTRSLRMRQELSDFQGEASSLNNVGNVYLKIGDSTHALEYYFKSLKLKQELGDQIGESATLSNIGKAYFATGDNAHALEYHSKGLALSEMIGDLRGEATSKLNLGAYFHAMGDLEKALDYHLQSLDVFTNIGDKNSSAITLTNIGLIMNDLKDYEIALDYLSSSIVIAEEIKSKELIYDACKALSQTYEHKGDFKHALEHYKLYHQMKEDVFSEDVTKRLKSLQVKLETERVEREKELFKLKNDELKIEQEKSEKLLLNILPRSIAERLKTETGNIVDTFPDATILFADIVGFSSFATKVSPETLVSILNDIFSRFDALVEKHQLEKVKTIGDAYMIVGGLPVPKEDHIHHIANIAIEMRDEFLYMCDILNVPFDLRIGIHTGAVVAGIIGTKRFSYDLWGDTVNIASRMESQSVEGEIQVTKEVYLKLQHDFHFEERGAIEVKGKGMMETYFLKSKK